MKRQRRRRAIATRHEPCRPGLTHEGEPVTLSTGEVVAWVCPHCLTRVTPQGQLTDGTPAAWQPIDDNGNPLPTLRDPGRASKW